MGFKGQKSKLSNNVHQILTFSIYEIFPLIHQGSKKSKKFEEVPEESSSLS